MVLMIINSEKEEVLFVLDRSGSMTGNPTKQLMYAMYAALKYLPKKCLFNIMEFGTSHRSLFPTFVSPSFENLFAARKCIIIYY